MYVFNYTLKLKINLHPFNIQICFDFQANLVEKVGGDKGTADGFKVLNNIMRTIINPSLLPFISWTGRGKGKEQKIAFNVYRNLVNMITVAVMKADSQYDSTQVQESLTYEVFKRAVSKYGKKAQTRKVRKSSVSSESSSQW